jgi:acyl-CoA synthetase (NDP forming)
LEKARTLYRSGKKKIISPPNAKYNVSKILENLKSEELQIGDALKLCQEYGLPVADYQVVLSEEEAIGFAEKAGYPFVIKVAGAGSLHKTDVVGVILNIQNQNGVVQAIQKIQTSLYAHKLTGAPKYLVQKMLSEGREIIIGGKQDPAIGPIVLCGLGDIYAEVLKDVNLCLAPVFYEEAEEMLLTLKGYDYLRVCEGRKRCRH